MNIDDSNIPREWCDLQSTCVDPSTLTNPLDCSRVYFGFKGLNQVGGEDVIDFTKDWTVIAPAFTNPPDDCTVLQASFNPITGTDTKYCFCQPSPLNNKVDSNSIDQDTTYDFNIEMESTPYESKSVIMCYKQDLDGSNFQSVTSEPFSIFQGCETVGAMVDDSVGPYSSGNTGGYPIEKKTDDLNECFFGLDYVDHIKETSHAVCRITERKAFADHSLLTALTPYSYSFANNELWWDKECGCEQKGLQFCKHDGSNDCDLCSSYSSWPWCGAICPFCTNDKRQSCESYCQYQNAPQTYNWDGLERGNSNSRAWGYYSFYVRYTYASTHWIGGNASPQLFTLSCEPCVYKQIIDLNPFDEFVWTMGLGFQSSRPDVLDDVKNLFVFSSSTDAHEYCKPLYVEFLDLSDQPLSNPSITLSAHTPIDVNPLQSSLALQTLTVDVTTPSLWSFNLKVLNSGKQSSTKLAKIVACGNEVLSSISQDFINLSINSQLLSGIPEFIIFDKARDGLTWFPQTVGAQSHQSCFDDFTLNLCKVQPVGLTCSDPWTNTSLAYIQSTTNTESCADYPSYTDSYGDSCSKYQDKKHECGRYDTGPVTASQACCVCEGGTLTTGSAPNNHQLKLVRSEPVPITEFYLHIVYNAGKKSGFRKIQVGICGNEKMIALSSTLPSFQLEVGTSQDGSGDTWTVFSEKFETNFYSNQSNCQISGYEIYSGLVKNQGQIVSLIPNASPSQIYMQSNQNGTFHIKLKTSLSISKQKFYLRAFSLHTMNHYDLNAFASFDIEMIDCREQSVLVNDPSKPQEVLIFQFSSSLYNTTIQQKFNSTNEANCPITSLTITKIEDAYTQQQVPSAMEIIGVGLSQDSSLRTQWVVLRDMSKIINYNVYIQASTGNATSPSDVVIMNLRVIEEQNLAPYFMKEPQSRIFVDLNYIKEDQRFTHQLPEVFDMNVLDQIYVQKRGSWPSFASINEDTPRFPKIVLNGLTEEDLGTYKIYVSVVDSKGAENEYSMRIDISKPVIFQGIIINETVEEVEIIQEKEVFEDEVTFQSISSNIETVSQIGNLTIRFSEPIYSKKDISWIENALELILLPHQLADDFNLTKLEFTWKPTYQKGDRLDIQVSFKEPLYISTNIVQDMIRVRVLKPKLFYSLESLQSLQQSSRVMVQFVPRQLLDNDLTRNFSDASSEVDRFLQVLFWILLVYNLFATGTNSMEHFIVMINSLQIVIHLPIYNVLLPSNVILFFKKLIPIVMFDIIKDDWNLNPIDFMELDEEGGELMDDPRFPRQMANIGYESHNFLQNIGSLQIFIMLYFMRLMLVAVLKVWIKLTGRGKDFYEKQFKRVFFSDLILLFIEGYIEFCIGGYLQFGNKNIDMSYAGEKLSLYFCFFSVTVALVFIPIGFIVVLTRDISVINSPRFKNMFGGLYEGIKTNSKLSLAYFFFFIIRRLIFLVIAFFMYTYPTIQFQMLYMVNLAATIYLGLVQPKNYWLMNYIELFNEGVFQLGTIHIVIFSDYVPSQDIQYACGFSMSGVLAFLIFINIVFVLWFGGHDIYLIMVKYYRLVRRYFDPSYMRRPHKAVRPGKLQRESLPDVYKPFNALSISNSNVEMEQIKEESSGDFQDEFTFRQIVNQRNIHQTMLKQKFGGFQYQDGILSKQLTINQKINQNVARRKEERRVNQQWKNLQIGKSHSYKFNMATSILQSPRFGKSKESQASLGRKLTGKVQIIKNEFDQLNAEIDKSYKGQNLSARQRYDVKNELSKAQVRLVNKLKDL